MATALRLVVIDPELRLVQPASGMAHRSDQEA